MRHRHFRHKAFSQLLAVIALFTCPAILAGQSAEEGRQAAMAGLKALIDTRETVSERFAVFAVGERHRQVDGQPNRVTGVWKIRSGNRIQDFTYLANGHQMLTSITNRQKGTVNRSMRQHWAEVLTCGEEVKARAGSAMSVARNGYQTKPPKKSRLEFLDDADLNPGFFEPFDDLVLHPMFLDNSTPNDGWIERVYRDECELLGTTTKADGDVTSQWHWRHKNLDFNIRIEHAKKHGYLPVEVRYKGNRRAFPFLDSLTLIDWEVDQSTQQLVPRRLATAYRHGTVVIKHFLRFDWRLGRDADESLFATNRDDFRLPYGVPFAFRFDTYIATGKQSGTYIPGTTWMSPNDLVIDRFSDMSLP